MRRPYGKHDMKIYTKTGDAGDTGLFRGTRVPKNDPRVEAYGNADELNAVLGVLLSKIKHPEISAILSSLQHELFELGADLAAPAQDRKDESKRIPEAMVVRLEQLIDQFEETLP